MLNYLGPNFGPNGPEAASLPPAVPGTMPDAVPGVPTTPAPPPPMIMPRGPAASPAAMAAITPQTPGGDAAAAPLPPPEYGVITQEDGTLLLHVKNPDGSMGPILKVLPPMKPAGQSPAK